MARAPLTPGPAVGAAAGVVALVAAAALLLAGGPGTWASWSDQATVTGTTVTSGTLDLVVDGDADDVLTWSGLTLDGVAPGESQAAELTIANAGSVPFTWTVDAAASGGLAPSVTVDVVTGGTASAGSSTYPRSASCTGGVPAYFDALGATPAEVVAAQGPLGAGETATLCVRLRLAADAPNAAQGLAMTPSFTVRATQETP